MKNQTATDTHSTTTATATRPTRRRRPKPGQSRPERQQRAKDQLRAKWAEDGLPIVSGGRLTLICDDTALATIEQYRGELTERFASGSYPNTVIDQFIAAATDITDVRDRYAVVRLFEKLADDTTPKIPRPDWPAPAGERRRVFTTVEAPLLRYCALRKNAWVVGVGCCEAGAGGGELHLIVREDVSTNEHQQQILSTAGTERPVGSGYPVAHRRRLVLPPWVAAELAAKLRHSRPGQTLLYGGASNDLSTRQSAVLMSIKNVLNDAGLGQDPTVRPQSIRNTAARHLYDMYGIEAAAAFLGIDDLNFVQTEIGLRPHPDVRKR